MSNLKLILVAMTILAADIAWGKPIDEGFKFGLDLDNSYREFGTQVEEVNTYAAIGLFAMKTDVYGARVTVGPKIASQGQYGVYALYSYSGATSYADQSQGFYGWHEVELLIKGKYWGISAGPKYNSGYTNFRGVDVDRGGTFKMFVYVPKFW